MRYKVDVHPHVTWFVKHRCSPQERTEFYEALDRLRSEPLKHSRMLIDPELSQHALRCFRFGTNSAVFKFDPGRGRIWMLKCQKLKPKHGSERGSEETDRRGP